MDGFIPCFCELAYRISPVSEDLNVVNNCHISLSFQGSSTPM